MNFVWFTFCLFCFYRVIQKNLVFAVGLPLELSQDVEKKEKILQLFRQFGPTLKETITDKTSYAGTQVRNCSWVLICIP